jgi:hypothetical protein
MHTAELHRRQIICQLPADPRGLTITQQKRYCSRRPRIGPQPHRIQPPSAAIIIVFPELDGLHLRYE